VQQAAGWAMASGRLSEMQTGEGKTLTAVFPAAWFAFAGRGCHVLTDNDYLAERDAEELAPVFEKLGLSVGCVTAELSDDDRRVAYERDVTYATVQECGFDFLRDRLRLGVDADEAGRDAAHGLVQRPLWAAVVDEADSILLDSARTPLIIAAQAPVDPVD
ncbi:MAG: translocase, partial [Planctomycetota bacterium]